MKVILEQKDKTEHKLLDSINRIRSHPIILEQLYEFAETCLRAYETNFTGRVTWHFKEGIVRSQEETRFKKVKPDC